MSSNMTLNYRGSVSMPVEVRQGYLTINGTQLNQVFNSLTPAGSYADITIEYTDRTNGVRKLIVVRLVNDQSEGRRVRLYNGTPSSTTLIKSMPYVQNYDLTFGICFHEFWKQYQALVQYGDNRTWMFISQDAYLYRVYYYGNVLTLPSLTLIPNTTPPPETSTTTHDASTTRVDYEQATLDMSRSMENMIGVMTQLMNMVLMMTVMTMPIRMMGDLMEGFTSG